MNKLASLRAELQWERDRMNHRRMFYNIDLATYRSMRDHTCLPENKRPHASAIGKQLNKCKKAKKLLRKSTKQVSYLLACIKEARTLKVGVVAGSQLDRPLLMLVEYNGKIRPVSLAVMTLERALDRMEAYFGNKVTDLHSITFNNWLLTRGV